MSGSVEINTGGYAITQDDIDMVTNPFLDLDKALGATFYFLEGQYDQIVLEKIFVILNSCNPTTLENINDKKGAVGTAAEAYNEAVANDMIFQEIGAYNIADLIASLEATYTVNGISPSNGLSSCRSLIDIAYANVLSLVCNLYEEAIGSIDLTNPNFAGNTDLSTLKTQLDTNVINLKTSLQTQFNINLSDLKNSLNTNIPLDALKTALEGIVEGLSDGDNKNNINAAITAINTYNTTKDDTNLQAVKTALDAIKDYTELSTVKTSVTNAVAIIAAIDAINTYDTTKDDTNLQAVKAALEAITGLSGVSTQISIPGMISSIGTYFIIGEAQAAITTFRSYGGKTKLNLDAVVAKLSALNTAIDGFPANLKTTYYTDLKNAINIATSRTSGMRSKLNGLSDAINAYKGATSLIATPDLFQEIKRAFNAFADGEIQTQFVDSELTDLDDRLNTCNSSIGAIFSSFEGFYENLNTFITICQNDTVRGLLTITEQQQYYEGNPLTLKGALTYANLNALCNTLNRHLNDISGAVTTAKTALEKANTDLEGALKGFSSAANPNDLLNLCMMASTPKPQADGTYRLVTGIQRSIDTSSGNFIYALTYGGATLSKAAYDASFSKEDGYIHYSLPYFALAIMYEKVGIQQLILVEQLKQIEEINDAIKENNTALRALSYIYEKTYGICTESGHSPYTATAVTSSGLENQTGMSMPELKSYLANKVKSPFSGGTYTANNSSFSFQCAQYNKDGDTPGQSSGKGGSTSTATENIDVKEQATLTMLSNKQDSTRIYGDQLSTDSQLMTTKMSQYMQDSNACVSACSQVVKSIGEYFKTNISNIR